MKTLENKELFSKAKDGAVLYNWILCILTFLKAGNTILEGIPLHMFIQATGWTIISELLLNQKNPGRAQESSLETPVQASESMFHCTSPL